MVALLVQDHTENDYCKKKAVLKTDLYTHTYDKLTNKRIAFLKRLPSIMQAQFTNLVTYSIICKIVFLQM